MSSTPGFLLWRLATKWRASVDRALAPHGLTHAQYALLASLLGLAARRPTQRELADHTGLEPLYVSKLARALEVAGLVDRAGDPDDSRAVRLSLTAEGRAVTHRAVGIVAALQDRHLAPLGGRDSARAQRFVRDLTALLSVDFRE